MWEGVLRLCVGGEVGRGVVWEAVDSWGARRCGKGARKRQPWNSVWKSWNRYRL